MKKNRLTTRAKTKKLCTLYFVLRTYDRSSGFTLIEILVYGVVFSVFLFLVVQVFVTIKATSANSLAMINLQQNYARILADLNQTIKLAQVIDSPVAGESDVILSLDGGEIVYQVASGQLEKVVNGSSLALSDQGVSVLDINFENLGEATQTGTIKINFTTQSNYLLEGGRRLTEDFQTTVGIR